MKTQSYLITIPRNTAVHYQEIPISNIDNNTEQTINNIVISIDTTSLYNIRETNIIDSVIIKPGYFSLESLLSLLQSILSYSNNILTIKKDVDFSNAKSLSRIFFHNSTTGLITQGKYNVVADITGGLNIIKIYSNIIKDYKVTTSLIDVPIYVNIGLDNVISRNNLGIPVFIPNNTTHLKFYLTDIYDEIITLNQPVYINIVINYDS